ncbi:MAG: DUF3304 domain-containing protein [Rhizobacter sp.]
MRDFIVVLFAACALLGCMPDTPAESATASQSAKSGKTVGAELTGYNHTDKTIAAFYVNGEWGGNITPGSGGGKFVCCIALPAPWYPGLKVKVTWEDHEGKMQAREVAVPEYDPKTLSGFNVHFLRSGEIKVFANRLSLWHSDYPLKGKEAELKPGIPIVTLPRE